ncbi:MAG: hypothetical protein QOH41_3470 [Blastocatellia bacterium]|nr:hypothetical protein [Blastocatellia bacterium]
MARNDVVLLDSLVDKARDRLGKNRDESEIFELFCFDQLLKDYDLSYDELEEGWTDGTDDGGVDGFFIFVDGKLVTEDVVADLAGSAARLAPEVQVVVFTIRRSDSFKQQPINALCSSIPELFDLRKTEDELGYPFSSAVLSQRAAFLTTFVALADRRPNLRIKIYYCSRGDTNTLAENLRSRAEQLRENMRGLFSHAVSSVEFKGASELLELARRQPIYSLRLRFIESYISREGKNYVVLATLPDYFAFISDEAGELRRYLFESNVRDYLGKSQINSDIIKTLQRKSGAAAEDFWWLNNGVTILATHATVVGKEISLENVQIVNGLQTTEAVHQYLSESGVASDDRSILLKIILTSDEAARARIIKATNYQNTVELASLRGLDKIQHNIEEFLADKDWFYDRRKNFYKNQGKPADRIVSISYLADAVRAIALADPASSQRQRGRALRIDRVYSEIFNTDWDLDVYWASLEITRRVQTVLESERRHFENSPIALVHHVGFIYACSKLGLGYSPSQVGQLAARLPNDEEVFFIREELRKVKGTQQYLGTIPLRESSELTLQKFGAEIRFDHAFVQEIVKEFYAQSQKVSGSVKRLMWERNLALIEGTDGRNYYFHKNDLQDQIEFGASLIDVMVEFDIKRPAFRSAGTAENVRKRVETQKPKDA